MKNELVQLVQDNPNQPDKNNNSDSPYHATGENPDFGQGNSEEQAGKYHPGKPKKGGWRNRLKRTLAAVLITAAGLGVTAAISACNPFPNTPPAVELNVPKTAQSGESVDINAKITENNPGDYVANYTVDIKESNGDTIPIATSVSGQAQQIINYSKQYTFPSSGNYTVEVTAVDKHGLSGSGSAGVDVSEPTQATQPTTPTTPPTTQPSAPTITNYSFPTSANEGTNVTGTVTATTSDGGTLSATAPQSWMTLETTTTSGNSTTFTFSGTVPSLTEDTPYAFDTTVTDSVSGKSVSKSSSFEGYNLPDYSGAVYSVEQAGFTSPGSPVTGEVAVYEDSNGTPVPIPENEIGGAIGQTSDGAALVQSPFNFVVKKGGLAGIILEGGQGNFNPSLNNMDGGYIATFAFPDTKDHSNVVVMTVPYPSTSTITIPNASPGWKNISPKDFANFVYYANKGNVKWNFDNQNITPQFKGIEIAGQNSDSSIGGNFSSDEQTQIARIVYDTNSKYYVGNIIKGFINQNNWTNYIHPHSGPPIHLNGQGWVVVEPNNDLYKRLSIFGTTSKRVVGNGYVSSALIQIDDTGGIDYAVDAHEFLRAFTVILDPPTQTSLITSQNPQGYVYPLDLINGKYITGNYSPSNVITPQMSLIQNPVSVNEAQPLDVLLGEIFYNKEYLPLGNNSFQTLGVHFGQNSLPYN